MRISVKQLVGLPVLTQGGTVLGKVSGADFDSETGRLTTLRVKTRGVIPGLLNEELLIDWSQIVEISEKQVVVVDSIVPGGVQVFSQIASAASSGVQLTEQGEG